MSDIKNFFQGLYEKIEEPTLSYVWNYFGKTKTGEIVEQKVTSAVISDYLKNPVVLIVIVILIYFVLKGVLKK